MALKAAQANVVQEIKEVGIATIDTLLVEEPKPNATVVAQHTNISSNNHS